jgi:hypothetical protein
MSLYTCSFTIPAGASNGAKLTGSGFGATPRLVSGDSIQVIVRWAGNNPPSQLKGRFMISPAVASQTTPSPFLNGTSSRYLCYGDQTVNKDTSDSTYTFTALAYGGSNPGSYELTFVAEDISTAPPTQWSEDPEFDTGG